VIRAQHIRQYASTEAENASANWKTVREENMTGITIAKHRQVEKNRSEDCHEALSSNALRW